MKANKIISRENYSFAILIIIWIIIQAALFHHFGIVTGFEAEKYINEATYFLRSGKLSSDNFWLYSTQIFLIIAAIKLHLGFFSVVIVQLVLNLWATWMFYKLALFFLKNSFLSFLVVFFFIINVAYQKYNSFLFTESVFYSLTVIYSSYLLRINKPGAGKICLMILMLALLSITRPTGILFLGATAVFFYYKFLSKIPLRYKVAILTGSAFVFFVLIDKMLQTGGSLDFMLPFKKENIICGVNTTSGADIQVLEKGNSIEGLFFYVIHNKQQFLKLSGLKTIAFFGMVRSYYSSFHNTYLILFFYPFYLLSIVGILKMFRRKEKIVIYFITIILLYWVTTLLTCDDWHNRFILTVTPFIFLTGIATFTNATSQRDEINKIY